MNRPVIIALDFPNRTEALDFLTPFAGENLFLKVGMELFYREGPQLVELLKSQGHRVFLDLKLHDIPNTVKRAARVLAGLGVELLNVHAAGGRVMLEAAVEGLKEGTPPGQPRPKCIAVTQLTSITEEALQTELLVEKPLPEVVAAYAKLARQSGLDGVVCSALEVPYIKRACGTSFLTVTPGIRLTGDDANDQQRVATPARARALGSDAIVVGRSITRAADPVAAYQQILHEWGRENEQ